MTLHGTTTGLRKVHPWSPVQRAVLVQTDASPFGLGGIFSIGGNIVAYFSDHLHDEDFELFGSCRGDPAFQSEYELLAVLVALRVFAPMMQQHQVNLVVIRGDLRASSRFQIQGPQPHHDTVDGRSGPGTGKSQLEPHHSSTCARSPQCSGRQVESSSCRTHPIRVVAMRSLSLSKTDTGLLPNLARALGR